mmetsp:Transcript_53968/g.174330  ORF Transcript_53968/g.174330 Transcript_53968/m.174330 type:complete len:170 (-) Transcript_53968:162-671(-)
MALRLSAGQLAVCAGAEEAARPWVAPLLVAALKDCEVLQPTDPMLKPVLFRTLAALGTSHGHAEPVTAEGLFRSAVDYADQAAAGPLAAALATGRGRLWRAQVLLDFAQLLENSRRAEERKSDIAFFRRRAGELLQVEKPIVGLSARDLRWSLVWLPPPPTISPADLGF